jgi:hypothetical protein
LRIVHYGGAARCARVYPASEYGVLTNYFSEDK